MGCIKKQTWSPPNYLQDLAERGCTLLPTFGWTETASYQCPCELGALALSTQKQLESRARQNIDHAMILHLKWSLRSGVNVARASLGRRRDVDAVHYVGQQAIDNAQKSATNPGERMLLPWWTPLGLQGFLADAFAHDTAHP